MRPRRWHQRKEAGSVGRWPLRLHRAPTHLARERQGFGGQSRVAAAAAAPVFFWSSPLARGSSHSARRPGDRSFRACGCNPQSRVCFGHLASSRYGSVGGGGVDSGCGCCGGDEPIQQSLANEPTPLHQSYAAGSSTYGGGSAERRHLVLGRCLQNALLWASGRGTSLLE